jgi:hypothetical protein
MIVSIVPTSKERPMALQSPEVAEMQKTLKQFIQRQGIQDVIEALGAVTSLMVSNGETRDREDGMALRETAAVMTNLSLKLSK